MSIITEIVPTQAKDLFRVWYERFWDFGTPEEAKKFAVEFNARKCAECASYGFTEPPIFLYLPEE